MKLDVQQPGKEPVFGSAVLLVEWAVMVSPKALHSLHRGFISVPQF